MENNTIKLYDLWRFQPDPTWEGEALGYSLSEYDDTFWREVRVPGDFETCHPALEAYEGAGWFRRSFAAPDTWRGKRVCVHFEGVNYHAKVWVNGCLLGEHHDGFLPFDFEIQDVLNFDDETMIAVRADNVWRQGDVPGLQRGWRTFGGILREVTLVATDLLHIAHIITVAEIVEGAGSLSLRVTVQNERTGPVEANVHARVLAGDGGSLAELRVPSLVRVEAGEAAEFALEDMVIGVRPWSPSDPALYTLVVDVWAEGKLIDTQTVRIGFRNVTTRDGKLLLNGEPIYLTGFNRHEDSARANMCPDLETVRRDLEAMKEAGANFVRLCHYPHHPGELDLCDELGLLAMGEIPLYWWDGLQEGEEACARKLDAAMRQLRAMIRRDINHPSIIFWSVSNKTQEQCQEVASGNRDLIRLAKNLDPTRLAVHVSDRWRQAPNFDADDVICVNAYPSWYERSHKGNAGYELAQSTRFWRDELQTLHQRYPGKPILITEFGACSFQGVMGNAFGEDVHADILLHEFAGMDAPYVCGATVWCWADHPWPVATFEFCRHLAFSPYGVVTRDRRKLKPFWTIRRLFRERQGIPDPPGSTELYYGAAGYGVYMIRPHLADIPYFPFPDGFGIRSMRLDEGALWVDIQRDAEPYFSMGAGAFWQEFGYDLQATQWRSYIVTDAKGLGIGVISAWYNQEFKGGRWGQIHWVALRPAYWGKSLAKPMMSYTLTQMAQWHDRAFLGTQTKRLPAIKLYLGFGFVPDLDPPGAVKAWREVAARLRHPALDHVGL